MSTAVEEVVRYFHSLDSLSEQTKEISVEHAREILKKLRILKNEDSDEEKRDLDEEKKEIAEELLEAIKAFLNRVQEVSGASAEVNDTEFSSVFEKAAIACGRAIYKIRSDIIAQLIKQGKTQQASSMQAQLERETPDKFKLPVKLSDVASMLEQGFSYAEVLQQRIAAGLEVIRAENLAPPPPPPKKDKDKDAKDKALDVLSAAIGIGYKVLGVNKKDLVAAAEQVNSKAPDPHLEAISFKVAGVNKKELVEPAQKANEQQQSPIDPALRQR